MKLRLFLYATLGVVIFSLSLQVATAECGDTWKNNGAETYTGSQCQTTFTKSVYWKISWLDGYERAVEIKESGAGSSNWGICKGCWPVFHAPYWYSDDGTTAYWNQFTDRGYWAVDGYCNHAASESHRQGHTCRCDEVGGGDWGNCQEEPAQDLVPPCQNCSVCCDTPVLVDTAGDGFNLTDTSGGVTFDLNSDGLPEAIPWTDNGDDAWLALDRNGNGTIDSGSELFGNHTPQPEPPTGIYKNGFLALGEYDRASDGGNGDGQIDSTDLVFLSLRLWRDENHNGVSEPSELYPLSAFDVKAFQLDYKLSNRIDKYGNWFRYRAKIVDAKHARVGRWAWDVILAISP